MDHQIIEESSSCDTASYSEPSASRQITLDVYYTSIYRDPRLLSSNSYIHKKQFFIFRDSFILAHRESNLLTYVLLDAKVKIAHRKK